MIWHAGWFVTHFLSSDVANLLVSMKAATECKKGDPTMKDVVLKARTDMNDFTAVRKPPAHGLVTMLVPLD
jgi:hypothetical protein